MNYNQIKSFFMGKEGVTLEHPYGEHVDVFKVDNNKFGVLTCDKDIVNVIVKCEPEEALALRDIYHSIVPGCQVDKKSWNTMIIDGGLPDALIKEQIDRSYNLVTLEAIKLQHA